MPRNTKSPGGLTHRGAAQSHDDNNDFHGEITKGVAEFVKRGSLVQYCFGNDQRQRIMKFITVFFFFGLLTTHCQRALANDCDVSGFTSDEPQCVSLQLARATEDLTEVYDRLSSIYPKTGLLADSQIAWKNHSEAECRMLIGPDPGSTPSYSLSWNQCEILQLRARKKLLLFMITNCSGGGTIESWVAHGC